jgi:radical SAM superfamily enzyme YgiQ (UPF0313 family)
MKNLLLINPAIHDFAAYNLWTRPLGLLYLSSILKKIGFNINFIDCLDPRYEKQIIENDRSYIKSKSKKYSTYQYYKKEIDKPHVYKSIKDRKYYRFGIGPDFMEKLLQKFPKPNAVLITSMMTYWYGGVFEAINTLKNVYPDVPVILGGIYAKLCPSHAQSKSKADYIITTNNIIALLDILSKILNNTSISQSYKKLPLFKKPDIFNFFPDMGLYETNTFIPILTSSGCIYNCKYCASNLLHDSFLERNYSDVLNEIIHWKNKFDSKDFAFYDDALLFNKGKRIKPLLKEIIKNGLNINLHSPNGLHINEIDKELAHLMKEAGFKTIRLGFETSVKKLQEKSSGKTSNKEFEIALKNLFQAGFTDKEIGVYILMGFPGQTPEDVAETIKFVKSHYVKPKLCEYSNIPNTAYFNKGNIKDVIDMINEPLYHNNTVLHLWNNDFSKKTIDDLKLLANN